MHTCTQALRPVVNIGNVHTCREFLWVYLSQTDHNCQETKSQWIENFLQKMAVLYLILYITIKGEGVRGLHEIHW